MKTPRVQRGKGPARNTKLTKANYRKKTLPLLLADFERRCAYCLDPDEFRHPSLNHVEHFNCKLKERARHQYRNLMLACAACNQTKHDKPVVNPLDKKQRLLNCTEENEFPEHIRENAQGEWEALTPAGEYHLTAVGLQERCHTAKRHERQKIARRILSLLKQAIQYQTQNPEAIHNEIMGTVRDMLGVLDKFPPLVTEQGVMTVRDWLKTQGIKTEIL